MTFSISALRPSHKLVVAKPYIHSTMARRSVAPVVRAQNGTESEVSTSGWDHVLVAIIDNNPTLSTASRAALATAAGLAGKGQLTCLFLDDQGHPLDGGEHSNSHSRNQLVQKQMHERGINVSILEESIEHSSGKGSVAVGEAADTVGADLVVLSSEAIHGKHVDANLLSEFVPAPVLLLP